LREDLFSVVEKVWKATHRGHNAFDRWQNCLVKLRSSLKGWNNNVEGQYRRDKDLIAGQLNFIDKIVRLQGYLQLTMNLDVFCKKNFQKSSKRKK
jgi:hypothetical protein